MSRYKSIIIGGIILIIIVFNVIISTKYINLRQTNEMLYKEFDKSFNNVYWKQNMIANYINSNKKIDNSIIINQVENKKFKDFLKNENNMIFFYPHGVCDVCDKDIFELLSSYSNQSFYKNIIALVPVSSYRDFHKFNKEYNLNIEAIFTYDGSIMENQEPITRGSFFVLNKELKINDIYVPCKPIVRADFDIYIKKMTTKYNLNNIEPNS